MLQSSATERHARPVARRLHTWNQILIVDEVLAVSDGVSKKVRKMQDVSAKTSAQCYLQPYMLAVQKLCTSGLLFEKGCIRSSVM
jgi:ABC-type polysaccharide/polyol phosphate transport system ATPase subunit